MSEITPAIFISYASQDAAAARRLGEALRAAGLETWLDQSELRGGDAWDAAIRQQISGCTLFIPLISANTNARGEGYFRLEWQLAVDRSARIADDQAFLLPVLIDGTPEGEARVPDRFRTRQWTHLPDGAAPAAFIGRLEQLLARPRLVPASEGSLRARGNLPAPVDTFVARSGEIAEAMARLAETRLLTLVGVGGTGKTRLALEVANRLTAGFVEGVLLVELAPVTLAESVPNMVADLAGVVQQPGKTVTESLVHALRSRSLLLVLDNCEHLLDAVADLVASITAQCPAVRILATSREGLAIRGEQVLQVRSLADADGALLFRDRARAAGASCDLDDATLQRISHRLDGMPLAIELAAARCGSMSPEEIESRLDDRFRLLRGARRGRLERHQTLRNTVAWSYDLLEPVEQMVFNRLSVFAGSFNLEAAQGIVSDETVDELELEDAIDALVTRSMALAAAGVGGTRYRLLETLRQFGQEQLVASGAAGRLAGNHTAWYAEFMARAWQGLWGTDDAHWIAAVGEEFENLRVAVFTAIDQADHAALTALIRPHLWWAWHSMRYEVGDWAEAALAVSPEPPFARAVATHLRLHGGRPADAVRLAEGLKCPDQAVDADEACMVAQAHWAAAVAAANPGGIRQWMEQSARAAKQAGNIARAAVVGSIRVAFNVMAGEMETARHNAAEAHAAAEVSGNATAQAWTNFFMGRAKTGGDAAAALQHFQRAVELATRSGNPLVRGLAATEAAVIIARSGDPEEGRTQLAQALHSFIRSNDRLQLFTSAHHLAYFLNRVGRPDEAREVWRELSARQAFAAQHHRTELTDLLGPPGKCELTDDAFIESIGSVLDALDRSAPRELG
jgi:predicted ATPase